MGDSVRAQPQDLPRAIVEAIELWTDERYKQFLQATQPGPLEEEWFGWFQAEWKVARTINRQSKESVRVYLDTKLKRELSLRDGASVIDEATS
jgi:hypothetical protein